MKEKHKIKINLSVETLYSSGSIGLLESYYLTTFPWFGSLRYQFEPLKKRPVSCNFVITCNRCALVELHAILLCIPNQKVIIKSLINFLQTSSLLLFPSTYSTNRFYDIHHVQSLEIPSVSLHLMPSAQKVFWRWQLL